MAIRTFTLSVMYDEKNPIEEEEIEFDDEGMTEEEIDNYVREEAWEFRDRIAGCLEPDWEEVEDGD